MVQTLGPRPQADAAVTVEDVLSELADRREEFHRLGHVPRDFVASLKRIGVYRSATPRRFGGEPMAPADFLRLVERISVVDGSTGWVASFGSALVYLAALPLATQAELYADGPDLAFAGALFPVQPAEATDTGYRVTGRWKFGSGCTGADVLGVGIPGDADSDGRPRTVLLSHDQVELVPDWDVVGMRATGSYDIVVDGVEVPRERTFVRGGPATVDEPLYRYPTIAYAAQVLAVVGAGVARAALDHAEGVGAGRRSLTGAPALAERGYYRTAVAEAEATLRSARAYFYEVTEEVWATVLAGDPVTDRQNAHLRLASTHLARSSARTVDGIVAASGTAPIHMAHPLRLLQGDALVPQQHAFLGPATADAAGAVLLGAPPTVPGFR